MTYTKDMLRGIFQASFDLDSWQDFLVDFFHADHIRQTPELLDDDSDDYTGYYLGSTETNDHYQLGFFVYKMNRAIDRRKVGLRQLVKPYLNIGVDAALVVFTDGNRWRFSFICDIKDEATAPKRYTYVFGDRDNYYNTPVSRFTELQSKGISFANIKEAFSVEALTKQFYKDLFDWYQWAIDEKTGITFPNNTAIEDDDREKLDVKIIRMITRLMFVWFIKQKQLVPNRIFDITFLRNILKDFDPCSTTNGCYYNAILQNLFFATLNRAIIDDEGRGRGFAHLKGTRDLKSLYRYAELFTISEEEVIGLFAEVPFLNGGLFECLDKTKTLDGVPQPYNYDGFSRNDQTFADGRYRNRAVVPNVLFFHPERGLFPILSRYNFTIEENTPTEQQVALDPELLGKVFENLLGAYNPETKETARNQSGSFYTPREIVNYMVDESLQAYLGSSPTVLSLFEDDFKKDPAKEAEYQQIAQRLKAIKVLDPACGSGAFPMGLLNRMVDILQKIQPAESTYQLKLSIIEQCIYGSDKQSIAAQISKLRFFISLICDCERDPSKPNFGIPTLPNLETKFVAADSLIAIKRQNVFVDQQVEDVKKQLSDVRHEHFSAKSASMKRRLRDKDKQLRDKLSELLADCFHGEDAKQLAEWNPYDQNTVADFFDPEWMFNVKDGFDIVIGNPPYIQLQNDGGFLARLYEPCGYNTFARTGDIYCLFYERGHQLLKPGGHLCFITSNKWMRAGYGERTRQFFATQTDPQLLIDFAGVKIFESATVDTNILLFAKAPNSHSTLCAVTNRANKDSVKNLSLFVRQAGSRCDFSSSDSWVILSPIEQSIKRKIEAVGTPLKDWDINIYRGVLTGCNEAFIISTGKRDEILAACRTEEERARTAELIRPILRGRDIKRYGYEWAGLYLIATFPSRHYDIEQYPAVKEYLLSFGIERLEQTGKTHIINGEKVKARKKTHNKWFETQDSISYWEDFSQPKIVWNRIASEKVFALVDEGFLIQDSMHFMIGRNLKYLVAVLNSALFAFLMKLIIGEAAGGNAGNADNVKNLKVICSSEDERTILHLLETKNFYAIDEYLFSRYGLSQEEIAYIESGA